MEFKAKQDFGDKLKKGKSYEVISEGEYFCLVVNEQGESKKYPKTVFNIPTLFYPKINIEDVDEYEDE